MFKTIAVAKSPNAERVLCGRAHPEATIVTLDGAPQQSQTGRCRPSAHPQFCGSHAERRASTKSPAMNLADTIVALATPAGRSSRAILRISGPSVAPIVDRLLTNAPTIRAAAAARFHLDADLSLPVLVARFLSPASYTGEDVCEIQFPGSPHLAERVLLAVLACPGTRLAAPGEFSARAYLRGRLTLNEAEGVAATIAARSTEQLNAARSLLTGKTGDTYRHFADECATLLALVEAGIDFTDQEDVVPIAPAALADRVLSLIHALDDFAGAASGREHPDALPRVAIVGQPNAGKSTLFNALLARRRAVASPVAGTTRDVLTEPLDLSSAAPGAGQIFLQDLPGLDASPTSPIDTLAQNAAHEALEHADAILWCDPQGKFNAADLPASHTKPTLRVRTFADRPIPHHSAQIEVCALDGWHLDTLRRALADLAAGSSAASLTALLPRHRRALALARDFLSSVISTINPTAHALASPELTATHLRAALDALAELVGQISPDDIIGRVFATFCVGK